MDFVRNFRDLLISVEAMRVGATLVTENLKDFTRWKSLLASARESLNLFRPSNTT
jgi:predicted nucleic acid-binding protein